MHTVARQIASYGLVSIIEPEVDILRPDKQESEQLLKRELAAQLSALEDGVKVMMKLSIPTEDNFYSDLAADPHVVRIVVLSGGYPQAEANEKMARQHGLIASFSCALTQGLSDQQTDEELNSTLAASSLGIYEASITCFINDPLLKVKRNGIIQRCCKYYNFEPKLPGCTRELLYGGNTTIDPKNYLAEEKCSLSYNNF